MSQIMKGYLKTIFTLIQILAVWSQDYPLINRPRNYSAGAVAFADDRVIEGIVSKTIAIDELSEEDLAGVYARTVISVPGSPLIEIVERDMLSRRNAWQILLKILRNPKFDHMRGGVWGWLSYHPNYPHVSELMNESIKIFKSKGAELGAVPLMGLANFIAYAGTADDAMLFDDLEKAGAVGIDLARQRYTMRLETEKGAANTDSKGAMHESLKSSNGLNEDIAVTDVPSKPSEKLSASTPWSIIAVLIAAATGLLWLLLKRRS